MSEEVTTDNQPKKKKVIKGVAKTVGKYSLKTVGKLTELAGSATVTTVNALVKNPGVQKIATGAGLLAVSVMVPSVGATLLGTAALKYMIDAAVLEKNKSIIDEIADITRLGNSITQKTVDNVISPVLEGLNKGIKKTGRKYQKGINKIFSDRDSNRSQNINQNNDPDINQNGGER